MAHLHKPLVVDVYGHTNLVRVTRRTEDNLPHHVKGTVQWRTDQYHRDGYYVYSHKKREQVPLEFLEGHWYKLCIYSGFPFTSID